jgi:hypothetical protein
MPGTRSSSAAPDVSAIAVVTTLAPGEREVLLRREVVEDRLLGDVGGGRDLGDGDAVEAALGEEPAGRGGDGLASGALLACAKAFVLCA